MLQIQRSHFWRGAEEGGTENDTQITNRHVIDLLHAADSTGVADEGDVSEVRRLWFWQDSLVKMTHEVLEGGIIGVGKLVDLLVQSNVPQTIVLVSFIDSRQS